MFSVLHQPSYCYIATLCRSFQPLFILRFSFELLCIL
uniref:Uncharacterized protein n=1 Tax=Arundo donax TaxID=35708 RepID=A0A0A9GLJ9_ARUDO